MCCCIHYLLVAASSHSQDTADETGGAPQGAPRALLRDLSMVGLALTRIKARFRPVAMLAAVARLSGAALSRRHWWP